MTETTTPAGAVDVAGLDALMEKAKEWAGDEPIVRQLCAALKAAGEETAERQRLVDTLTGQLSGFTERATAAESRATALAHEVERMREALKEWEAWEAKLILDPRPWATDDGCHIPQDLWDEYVAGPQTKRATLSPQPEEK